MLVMNNLCELYIQARFPEAGENYKEQWRARFAKGIEWAYSDIAGRCKLQELAPNVYPIDVTKQIGEKIEA
jgi:hypothetical protein